MSMRVAVGRALLFTMIAVYSAAACSNSDEPSSSDTSAKVLGPDGGTLIGPGGATLIVPARALSTTTRLSITRLRSGYPALIAENGIASSVFAFEPHDQVFMEDVTIRIPYARGTNDVRLVTARPGSTWSAVAGTAQDGVMQAQTSHFSFYAVIAGSDSDGGTGEAGGSGLDGGAGAAGSAGSGDGGGDPSAGMGGVNVGMGGVNAGTGGVNAGTGGVNAGTGGVNAGTGGTSGGSAGGVNAGTGGTSGGSAGSGGSGAKVCMAPVANAPTGTSGLASYPKGIAQLYHYGSGTNFTTWLSLQFSTVDQCGYIMSGTMKQVFEVHKELYIRSATAAPPVAVGTYQPIGLDDAATGFNEGESDCDAGGMTEGESGTTLVITSINDTRVTGMVKSGSVTKQTFDLPICVSQVENCGCVP